MDSTEMLSKTIGHKLQPLLRLVSVTALQLGFDYPSFNWNGMTGSMNGSAPKASRERFRQDMKPSQSREPGLCKCGESVLPGSPGRRRV